MAESAVQGDEGAHSDKQVVLIAPEGPIAADCLPELRRTFEGVASDVRVLLYLRSDGAAALVQALESLGVQTEILVAPGVPLPPPSTAFVLPAIPGTTPNGLAEFALALSDVLLVEPEIVPSELRQLAGRLEKPVLPYGATLPAHVTAELISDDLSPQRRKWAAWAGHFAGRIEQAMLELFAFGWRGRSTSWTRLGRCFGLSWTPKSYFTDRWQELVPDAAARDAAAPIVARFDAMDCAALLGSRIHRDVVWVTYFLAAFAVLAAVAGSLSSHSIVQSVAWGVVELLTLGAIACLILALNRFELQDHWTACRLGAEQLRIARMSLPLLVMPSALAVGDKPPPDDHGSEIEYGVRGLAEAKRAIRAQGLPRLDQSLTPRAAADWVSLIVNDQIVYHRRNHAQLEHAEHRVLLLTRILFVIAVVSVLVHFVYHAKWLLLGTAAGPAFAAALHGVGTRLGIIHRAALSKQMETALEKVEESLKTVTAAEQDWPKVRRLTFQAAEEMGAENNSWRSLVRRYRDELV